jgi:hypothetical protein
MIAIDWNIQVPESTWTIANLTGPTEVDPGERS